LGELPSGKVRWEVSWAATGGRVSKLFDSHIAAKERYAEVVGQRPSSLHDFRSLAKAYLVHEEMLVKTGQHERSYLEMLEGHVRNHILPDMEFSKLRCCSLGTPDVQQFFNRLITRVSAKLAKKIRVTVSQIFVFGTQNGWISSNPAREARVAVKRRPDPGQEAPFVLPGKNVLRALLEGAKTFDTTGRATAVVRTFMFGGLRMSELRGAERKCTQLLGEAAQVQIVQRADRYGAIGSVKSAASRRTVDIGPDTALAIRNWLLVAPRAEAKKGDTKSPPQFLFPNENGGVWGYANFRARFWVPLMNHCGLVTEAPADRHIREASPGYADFKAPLFGPHMLRHVYASLQIERGVTPKRLQKLIGHSSLKMTLDTYGHLWPDESAERAHASAIEHAL
jgi:integrase